jgi:hypothetical protein
MKITREKITTGENWLFGRYVYWSHGMQAAEITRRGLKPISRTLSTSITLETPPCRQPCQSESFHGERYQSRSKTSTTIEL